MFHAYFKSLKFLILLYSCVSLVHCFQKRESGEEKSVTPPNSEILEEKAEEILTTIQTFLKNLDEDIKDFENVEIKQIAKEEAKEIEKEKAKEGESVDKEEVEKEKENELKKEFKEDFKEAVEKVALEKLEKAEEEEITNVSETISEENEGTQSPASPMLVTEISIEKEKSPEGAYAVWNTKGKICLLARFEADFLITYPGKGGEEKADVKVNKTGIAKGKCEHSSPMLQISWQKYVFTMMFNKTGDDSWVLTSMELTYDTSDTLFDRATNATTGLWNKLLT